MKCLLYHIVVEVVVGIVVSRSRNLQVTYKLVLLLRVVLCCLYLVIYGTSKIRYTQSTSREVHSICISTVMYYKWLPFLLSLAFKRLALALQ